MRCNENAMATFEWAKLLVLYCGGFFVLTFGVYVLVRVAAEAWFNGKAAAIRRHTQQLMME